MKRSVRPPFLEFLESCYSGVLDDPAIDELRGTVRVQDRDHEQHRASGPDFWGGIARHPECQQHVFAEGDTRLFELNLLQWPVARTRPGEHAGFSQWSYGDDPRQTLTKDDVLDDITLYWLTNTATSAGRLYWENGGKSPLVAAAWKTTDIKMPVAITVFGEDAYLPPETWARRAYPSLTYFHEVPKGGHFAAWEQPELFAAELRAAFRTLREAQ